MVSYVLTQTTYLSKAAEEILIYTRKVPQLLKQIKYIAAQLELTIIMQKSCTLEPLYL